MRYSESREQSAELLRLVLPHLSRQQASFNPVSYAVWYEYCAGINPGLKDELDALLTAGRPLEDADMQALFEKHVALRDMTASLRVGAQMREVMARVNDATTRANSEVTEYTRGLTEAQLQLVDQQDPQKIVALVSTLVAETERVRGQTAALRSNLDSTSQEVDRLREELQLAQGQAQTDPLTGLLNRRGLDSRISGMQPAEQQSCACLFIDIDHFKRVNDTHGHLLGDRVIAGIAAVIRSCVAERGLAARMGGEEFAVILPGLAPAVVSEVAERIRATVERARIRRHEAGGADEAIANITVSVGAATPIDGERVADTMRRADRALYKSKQDGRNRISLSTPGDG